MAAKLMLLVSVSDDLTHRLHAGRLADRIARAFGGRGGGSATHGEAGVPLTQSADNPPVDPRGECNARR